MKKQQGNKQYDDIFGMAIANYFHHGDKTDIVVHSPDFDDDLIPIHYLFRTYREMPVLERKALDNCRGRVLDVGSGAGSHALYLQQEKKLEVTAIDISPGAIEISRLRGLRDARNTDFFELEGETFDTILFLMNGTGIIEKLNNLDTFFAHASRLLAPGGKILIDSSDLRYLFEEDEDGGIWIDPNSGYYGEMEFTLSYKNHFSSPFPWLYLDYHLLELAASKMNFTCKLLEEGEHYDYLAKISRQPKEVQ